MTTSQRHFGPELFTFLRELRRHNDRDWFNARKERYVREVREPAQRFISDFGPLLARISRQFRADPRPSGGSLFRIYRDTRFSKDKSPYKTYTGIQFRHRAGRDAHAPGFYLHLEPGSVFAAAGVWHPGGPALARIRRAIADQPARWRRLVGGKSFRAAFEPEGESLKRAPKGFDPDHSLIEDLKRKDFIGVARLTEEDATAPGFLQRYAKLCQAGSGYVRFLCEAVGVPF